VLQARKKEMASGKRKWTSRRQSYPRWTSQRSILAKKMYQTPPFKPFLILPRHLFMPPPHKFIFIAPIEIKSKHVICCQPGLSEKVYLSVEELLAWLLRSEKHFKESTTTRNCQPTAKAQAVAAHTVSTLSMGMDHECLAPSWACRFGQLRLTDGTIQSRES